MEVIDLPEAIYLAEGQFVLVDPYGKSQYIFSFMIEEHILKNH